MKIVPAKLKVGAHRVGDAPARWDGFYSLITDGVARHAFKVARSKGGYYIVDGRREPRFYCDLDDLQFSSDGRAHAYSFCRDNGVMLNGRRKFGRGYSSFRFEDEGAELWTCRKWLGKKLGHRLVTSRGTQRYALSGSERITPGGKHVLYIALEPGSGTPLICDDEVLFDGLVSDVSAACNRYPYVSWMGSLPAAEDEHVYLLGARKERIPDYYEVMTFAVSDDHKRYMYGGAEENVEDASGDFIGEQYLYLDGKPQPGVWKEIVCWESVFSSSATRWACVARDHAEKHHALVDGREVGVYDRCLSNTFSAGGRRHGFIAYETAPGEPKPENIYAEWRQFTRGLVVIDGKVHDPGRLVEEHSLTFSPNERHFAFVSCESGRKGGNRIHLDGVAIDEADRVYGQTQWPVAGPRFSADSSRLYYFSVRGRDLFFNVAVVGKGR